MTFERLSKLAADCTNKVMDTDMTTKCYWIVLGYLRRVQRQTREELLFGGGLVPELSHREWADLMKVINGPGIKWGAAGKARGKR